MSILDTLNPQQEALALDAIEGVLAPTDRPRLDQLLAATPGLASEIDRLSRAKAATAALAALEPAEPDWAEAVVDRFEAERWHGSPSRASISRMDPQSRPLRFPVSARSARALAIAASLGVVAVLAFTFLESNTPNPHSPPVPAIAHADETPAPIAAADPSDSSALADGAVEQRTLERAQTDWARTDSSEPTLDEAVALLADQRLVIRALAPRTEVARAGGDALDAESTAWKLLGPAPALAARFDRPATQAVFALDEPTGRTVEIPRPRLDAVWTARLDQDPAAIASLVHSLESLGLIVRLEAADEPIEPDPTLDDALWWDRAPSTWQPFGMAPVVIDRLDR